MICQRFRLASWRIGSLVIRSLRNYRSLVYPL
jgi:hypothetical protein